MKPHQQVVQALEQAREAVLLQDQSRMFRSQQALTDHYHKRMFGVPVPEDEMIHIGDVTLPPEPRPQARKGLSPLAAVALGLLTAAVPAAGAIGYLIAAKPVITNTVEKIIDRPVEKIITKPGLNYNVDVDMEVIPPPQ